MSLPAMVYFDQNVYDHCCDNLTAAQLNSTLEAKNHNLVLGPQNLIELASCFKDDKPQNIERGKKLFRFLQELLPIDMLWDIDSLMRREILIAARKSRMGIFLTKDNKRRFEEEIQKLARGDFRATARKYILKDWQERISGKKMFEESYRRPDRLPKQEVANISFSKYILQNKTAYDEYRKQWTRLEVAIRYPKWARRTVKRVAKKISARPAKFVSFSVGAKINMFLNFKTARDKTFSHDMPMDLKHLSNAIHVSTFVTGDGQFRTVAEEITPGKTILDIKEYFDK